MSVPIKNQLKKSQEEGLRFAQIAAVLRVFIVFYCVCSW